jgi:hypothetical protein
MKLIKGKKYLVDVEPCYDQPQKWEEMTFRYESKYGYVFERKNKKLYATTMITNDGKTQLIKEIGK